MDAVFNALTDLYKTDKKEFFGMVGISIIYMLAIIGMPFVITLLK